MIKDKINKVKRGLKDRGKAKVGIMMHKKIGELFEFDDQAVRLTEKVIENYENGEKQAAAQNSKVLEEYIKARMTKERTYRDRAQQLSEKLEAHADKIEEMKENLDHSRFEKLLDGAVNPEKITEDVDQELLDEIYEGEKIE